MNLNDFLLWVATSVGATTVASFILERVRAYRDMLDAELKKWIFFGVACVVSVGSYCVLTYVPMEVLSQIAPFFALVATIFVSVFSGTLWHKFDKSLPKG
jgi:putative flippase GtrA